MDAVGSRPLPDFVAPIPLGDGLMPRAGVRQCTPWTHGSLQRPDAFMPWWSVSPPWWSAFGAGVRAAGGCPSHAGPGHSTKLMNGMHPILCTARGACVCGTPQCMLRVQRPAAWPHHSGIVPALSHIVRPAPLQLPRSHWRLRWHAAISDVSHGHVTL